MAKKYPDQLQQILIIKKRAMISLPISKKLLALNQK